MQLGLFFKIGYVFTISIGVWIEQDLTQLAAIILCGVSTGCDVMDNYFATEAITMINIVYKADLLAVLYVIFYCVFVTFPCGVLGQLWCLIVSIPDLCLFSYLDEDYFRLFTFNRNIYQIALFKCDPIILYVYLYIS